jgi:hypothetical protein
MAAAEIAAFGAAPLLFFFGQEFFYPVFLNES